MTRYFVVTFAGILSALVAVPAPAQQGRATKPQVADLSAAAQMIILYRGTSASRVYPRHPHGGPPGQLKKLNWSVPPGQAKKLYGNRAVSNEIEVEFDYLERDRFEQSRMMLRPGKLKKLYRRTPPGHVKTRGAKGFKRDKARKNRLR